MTPDRSIPRWLLRSSVFHDRLSAQAARLLMGLYGGTVAGQAIPATPRDIQITSGVPTRGPRLMQHVRELVDAGLLRIDADFFVLVETRKEHESLCLRPQAANNPAEAVVIEVAKPEVDPAVAQPFHDHATPVAHPCHDRATGVPQLCHDRATPVPQLCHTRGTGVQGVLNENATLDGGQSYNIDHKSKDLCSPRNNTETGGSRGDPGPEPKWPSGPDVRRALVTAWVKLFDRGAVKFETGDKRDRALVKALKLYRSEELTEAIEGYASDPWRREEPNRNELATLLKDPAAIDAGREKKRKGNATSSTANQRPAGPYPGRGAAVLGYSDADRDRAPRRGADVLGI